MRFPINKSWTHAVYPHLLCKPLKKDRKRRIKNNKSWREYEWKSISDEGCQQIFGNPVNSIVSLDLKNRDNCNGRYWRWGHQNKANQPPQKRRFGACGTVGGRTGWRPEGSLCSRLQKFSIQHLFLNQPLPCSFFPFPGRTLGPLLSVTCGHEIPRNKRA